METYWLEQRACDVPTLDDWLGAGEQEQLRNLRVEKRRADWRLGRWTAKLAVSRYLGVPGRLQEIEIRPEALGAPEVWLGTSVAPVVISLSHSHGVAACAIASGGRMLGCDLEGMEARSAAFAADYFGDEEQRLAAQAADGGRVLALLWSAKESALKALRIGLRMDMRRLAVSYEEGSGGGWHAMRVRVDAASFEGWWAQSGELVRTVVSAPAGGAPSGIVPQNADKKKAEWATDDSLIAANSLRPR